MTGPLGKTAAVQPTQHSPGEVGGGPTAPRRPLPESMVPETWLAPLSVITESMTINPPKEPVTPEEGNQVMNVVALEQLPRDLLRHEDSWPLSRPVGRETAPNISPVSSNCRLYIPPDSE